MDGGRLQELGMRSAFRQRTLGFQKVDPKNVEGRKKVRSWLGGWYPAEVEGSDCKSLEEIGKGPACYLQLGDLSFAAVKYALSDHYKRVSRERRRVEHSYVRSAAFEGGVLDGKTVRFSPHLNTIIGVRGSGKSSVLECVRYALDVPLGSTAYDQRYKSKLVEHVLGSGGAVTLRIVDASGGEFEVRRIHGEEPRVFADGVEVPNVSAGETMVHKPIYFGQKDLAAAGFEKDLVEKFIWQDLQDIRGRIRRHGEAMREIVEALDEFADTDQRRRELEFKQGNAEAKIKFYEKYGIEERLKKRLAYDDDEASCTRLERITGRYLQALDDLIDEFEGKLEPDVPVESQENAEILKQVFEVFQENSRSLADLKRVRSDVDGTLGRLVDLKRRLWIKKDSLREEFAGIERAMAEQFAESAGTRVSAEEYRRLRRTAAEASEEIEELGREVSRRAVLEDHLCQELGLLQDAWRKEYDAIQRRVEARNEKHPALRIRVTYKADRAAYLERLKATCRGSGLREATLALLVERFEDFGHMYLGFEEAKEMVGRSAGKFEDYFMRSRAELLTWQVPHSFAVEYRGKDLRTHSLGQRASALIIFILSQQDNDVILIDQPEDDLDSRTVYEDVIKLVRELKPRVQFIFATLHANFPVLGDAEKVLSCQYSDEGITVDSGSIDSQEIQAAVVDIMEGGAEAFNQRRKIYEMWDD
jgi:ABC-type cobalamin/Fe3+-siderophores transport system ATPase subunit